MLNAITLLLLFQLAGEAISLLFAALALRGGPFGELRETAQNLLQHLSLLFVPAGVGVILHLQRMADEWLPIVIALFAGTFITIAVTSLLLRALTRHLPTHVDTERQP